MLACVGTAKVSVVDPDGPSSTDPCASSLERGVGVWPGSTGCSESLLADIFMRFGRRGGISTNIRDSE